MEPLPVLPLNEPLVSDQTVYYPRDHDFAKELRLRRRLNGPSLQSGLVADLKVRDSDGREENARGFFCSSYEGKFLSVSLRCAADKRQDDPTTNRFAMLKSVKGMWEARSADAIECLAKTLFSLDSATNVKPQAGIVVVAGATNCLKSTFVRGLICYYLGHLTQLGRLRPHLLTFEDPIEGKFGDDPFAVRNTCGLDYTPLRKDEDACSLEAVVDGALRQSTALLYVAEARRDEDWHQLLRFAGTGHLVITTTHAGSLTETFTKIFRAVHADLPALRQLYADRVYAVVHLKNLDGFVLPAVWRRTSLSIANLVTDGLSSLIPRHDKSIHHSPTSGRAAWLKTFAVQAQTYLDNAAEEASKRLGHQAEAIRKRLEFRKAIRKRLEFRAVQEDLFGV